MTLVEHLLELRSRLFKSAVALLVAFIFAFIVFEPIFEFIKKPYCDLPPHLRGTGGEECRLFFTGVADPFLNRMKVSLIAGIVLAAPVWLYQVWAFITPGLHPRERKWAIPFVASSLVLFAAGATFAYISLARGLSFLLGFAGDGASAILTIDKYLSFINFMLLAFGVSFEFPLMLIFLELVGVVDYPKLRRWRRGMYFGIALFASVATPTQDPFTFALMAVPMWLFYEIAIVFARVHGKIRRRQAVTTPVWADDETSPLDEGPIEHK